jgi:uncharacterized membrane protein
MTRRPRLPTFFLGLLFTAIAVGHFLSTDAGGADLDPSVVWPILIIGVGVAGLLALLPGAARDD